MAVGMVNRMMKNNGSGGTNSAEDTQSENASSN